jgi:hypothetical protein
LFPEEVAGLFLLDGISEEFFFAEPSIRNAIDQQFYGGSVITTLINLGLTRFLKWTGMLSYAMTRCAGSGSLIKRPKPLAEFLRTQYAAQQDLIHNAILTLSFLAELQGLASGFSCDRSRSQILGCVSRLCQKELLKLGRKGTGSYCHSDRFEASDGFVVGFEQDFHFRIGLTRLYTTEFPCSDPITTNARFFQTQEDIARTANSNQRHGALEVYKVDEESNHWSLITSDTVLNTFYTFADAAAAGGQKN